METIVLDTSAVIADISCLDGQPGQTIILPMGVLQELNNFKHEGTTARGKISRDAFRLLEDFRKAGGNLHDGVTTMSGALLKVDGAQEGLDRNVVDDEIILTAKRLGASILSSDLALRIKASAHDVVASDIGANQGVDLLGMDSLDGYAERYVDCSLIDAVCDNDEVRANEDIPENQYLILRDNINPKHSTLVRHRKGRLHRLDDRGLIAWSVKPKNVEQKFAMDLLLDDSVQGVFLIGGAGTGKTFLACAAGMQKMYEERIFERIILTKPVIAFGGQDIGFLPGGVDDKVDPIYANLIGHFEDLCEKNMFKALREKGKIVMEPLAYIRGKSYAKSWIVIDEAQNLSPEDLKGLISRLGEGCKIILTGDPSQIDVPRMTAAGCGLVVAAQALGGETITGVITLKNCLRSELAKLAIDRL